MAYNMASNDPVESLAAPFPRYTKLEKVIKSLLSIKGVASNTYRGIEH